MVHFTHYKKELITQTGIGIRRQLGRPHAPAYFAGEDVDSREHSRVEDERRAVQK
jgi:hypothetical protein